MNINKVNTNKLLSLSAVIMAVSFTSVGAQAQGFVDIAKGGNQICGITTENVLSCTTNSFAERLEPPASVPALTQVGVGDVHACGLDLSGQAVCWGDNGYGQLNIPANVTFESIDVGWNHTCAITADLETVCWGLPDNNRLLVPTDGLPFAVVDANFNHNCGLEAAGGIRCWGHSEVRFNPPSSNANIAAFASSSTYQEPNICALLESGEIECNDPGLQFEGSYTDVATWSQVMCGLTTSGEVECQLRETSNQSLLNIFADIQAEVAQFNQAAPFVKLTSHHALCAIDAAAQIHCTDTISGGATGPAQRALNDVPLPSADSVTDFENPMALNNLSARVYSEKTVELFWDPIGLGGDGRVVGAEIYQNGLLYATTSNYSSYMLTNFVAGIDYTYEVRIVNSRGEVGPMSNVITVNTGSNSVSTSYVKPDRPASPAYVDAFQNGPNEVELYWNRADANLGVYGYEVYRDNVYLGFTQGEEYLDTQANPNIAHQYDVVAVEQDGTVLGFASSSYDF